MTTSIILAVHDRIDDLDVHLDIMDFSPPEWKKVIIWSHDNTPPDRVKSWIKRADKVVKINGRNFAIGPLLAFTAALKAAQGLGSDYCVYRNADDWVFNHKGVADRIKAVTENKFLFAGYNWVTHNCMVEFALNEVTCHVPTFFAHVDAMERSFINSSPRLLCEYKLARWVNKLIKKDRFLRLAERERSPGVGHDLETLMYQEQAGKVTLPKGWQQKWADNHRFFHKQWQLIGSHSQDERYNLYKSIRSDITYHEQLEDKSE